MPRLAHNPWPVIQVGSAKVDSCRHAHEYSRTNRSKYHRSTQPEVTQHWSVHVRFSVPNLWPWPLSVAFLRTFMAYSVPASVPPWGPGTFRTRNTWNTPGGTTLATILNHCNLVWINVEKLQPEIHFNEDTLITQHTRRMQRFGFHIPGAEYDMLMLMAVINYDLSWLTYICHNIDCNQHTLSHHMHFLYTICFFGGIQPYPVFTQNCFKWKNYYKEHTFLCSKHKYNVE